MKRCVLNLERKVGKEFEFRVTGWSEFQSRGPMTERAFLPSDDLTYGMDRTSENKIYEITQVRNHSDVVSVTRHSNQVFIPRNI